MTAPFSPSLRPQWLELTEDTLSDSDEEHDSVLLLERLLSVLLLKELKEVELSLQEHDSDDGVLLLDRVDDDSVLEELSVLLDESVLDEDSVLEDDSVLLDSVEDDDKVLLEESVLDELSVLDDKVLDDDAVDDDESELTMAAPDELDESVLLLDSVDEEDGLDDDKVLLDEIVLEELSVLLLEGVDEEDRVDEDDNELLLSDELLNARLDDEYKTIEELDDSGAAALANSRRRGGRIRPSSSALERSARRAISAAERTREYNRQSAREPK